jgi:hypothetical protein
MRALVPILCAAGLAIRALTPGLSAATTPQEQAAIDDLMAWAANPLANGPAGRPLPVAGHWNTGANPYSLHVLEGLSDNNTKHGVPVGPIDGEWSPNYMVDLIKHGWRVIPSFVDPGFSTLDYYQFTAPDPVRVDAFVNQYYRPALEYCRDHGLPIAFVGFNWEDQVRDSSPASGANTARVLRNGVPDNFVDPLGPVANWSARGTNWLGHPIFQTLQQIYPNPPLVLFFNNNEGAKINYISELGTNSDRFNALYPSGASDATKARVIREGYAARYAAMFAAGRAQLSPAWSNALRFVAYNAWSEAVMGRGDWFPNGDGSDVWFDPAPGQGYRNWAVFDGALPEFYDNQWQSPKTDFAPWSAQTEAFNYTAIQDMVFAERPNYYFSSIAWEGGRAAESFSKVNGYILGSYGREAQRWDADRYQGFHQFGLWATRPRDYREFRGGERRDGYHEATWQSLLAATEQVWNNATLRDYWRFGAREQNTNAATTLNGHYFDNNAAWPAWLKNLPRWPLLTCSANPAEATWNRDYNSAYETKLRVLALALRLGAAPNRRWLVYAHAPLGAVAGSQVTVPGYGAVTLDFVSRQGSFFEVRENRGTVTNLIRGGPAEIAVSANKRRVAVGESFTVTAQVTHPLAEPFTSFVWTTGEGSPMTQTNLAARTLSLATPGEHFITIEGVTAGGANVKRQAVVFVGPRVSDDVAFQLSFDRAFDWQGLWSGRGTNAVLYRLLPNAANDATVEVPVAGGAFVQDAQRGAVFQLANAGDGATLQVSDRTTYLADGHANLTISFWFKADALTGTQGLFAQGYGSSDGGGGYNIYLAGDRLYAGSWSITGRAAAEQWSGNWLSTASGRVVAGQWHHVTLVLRDATDTLAADKLFLYLDDNLIASGPAVKVKRHWTHPRLGFLGDTRIHTSPIRVPAPTVADPTQFRGRLDDFTYLTGTPAPADPATFVRAINAGGPALVGASGVAYEADTNFTGGSVRSVSATTPITASEDPDVYRTARQGAAFSYALPVANGSYRVKLKFAELDHFSAGQRRFGVTAEGQAKVSALDLFATVGNGVAHDVEFPITLADGTLDLAFTATTGSAMVAAIQVWKLGQAGTYQIHAPTDTPSATDNDSDYELGMKFRLTSPGVAKAVRYYRPGAETGTHTGRLWGPDKVQLAQVTFTGESASGWQQASFSTPVALPVGVTYTVSVNANTHYVSRPAVFTTEKSSGPLIAPVNAGVFHDTIAAFPETPWNASDYYRDIVVEVLPDPLQSWRLLWFGTSDDAGLAAGTANPDHDLFSNLLEYALGLNPRASDGAAQLFSGVQAGHVTLTYTRSKAATGVTLIVEVSDDLVTWSSASTDVEQRWQVADHGATETITGRALNPDAPLFMHLKAIIP